MAPSTKEYRQNYYQANRDRLEEKKREYNERTGYSKMYYEVNAEKLKQDAMEYYEKNKEAISARRKIRYQQKKAQKKLEQEK